MKNNMELGKLRRNFWVFVFVGLFSLHSVLCVQNNTESNDTSVLEKWILLDKNLKDSTRSIIKMAMPMLLESSSNVKLTSQCTKNILQVISGIRNIKKWAFTFLDSSGKIPDQTLSGTLSYLGVYDECLAAVAPQQRNSEPFHGQYCMVNIRPPLPPKTKTYQLSSRIEELRNFTGTEIMKILSERAHLFYFLPIKIGVCIPSGCTKGDLTELLKIAAQKSHFEVEVSRCEVKTEVHFDKVQVAAISVCAILGFLVVIGTLIDRDTEAEFQSKPRQLLLCFSLLRNFRNLTNTCSTEESLRCLHGMRFLSITWVVYGNAYFYGSYFITFYQKLFGVKTIITSTFAQTVTNSSMVVDTFFFMAGLLFAYAVIKYVKIERQNFNFIFIIFHKLWRIIPTYYFILLVAMLVPTFGSGPMFHEVMEKSVYRCYQSWWRNLLFINNFYGLDDLCWLHTWYMACYLQLFLLSFVVIIPLIKYEKLGVFLNVLMILLSIIYIGFITTEKRPAISVFFEFVDPVDRELGLIYIFGNAIARSGPYFLGFLTGYILVKKPDLKIPKVVQIIVWPVAICASLYSVYITGYYYNHKKASLIDFFAYSCFHHITFAIGIAWMTLCCSTGHGGFINKFLRWKVWVPLGKLTFLIYLIEPIVQTAYISVFKSTQEFTHFHLITESFGLLCISALLALLCHMLVEAPFQNLELILLDLMFRSEGSGSTKRNSFTSNDFQLDLNSKHFNGFVDPSLENKAFDDKM